MMMMIIIIMMVGRARSDTTVPCYGLDGPGIKSWLRRDCMHPYRTAVGPTQPPVQLLPGYSPGVNRRERGVDHLPASSAEVKERI